MLAPEIKEILRPILNAHSLNDVLMALSELAGEEAECFLHYGVLTQRKWKLAGERLEQVADEFTSL